MCHDNAPIEPGSTVRVIGTLTESQIRDAGASAPSGVATAPATTAAAESNAVSLPDGPPADQYNYARSFLMRRDFASAEVAFRTFIDANPESSLVGNAQYWLGETYWSSLKLTLCATLDTVMYYTYSSLRAFLLK